MRKPKSKPIMLNMMTIQEVVESVKNAPPLTPEQMLEAAKLAKEAGCGLFFVGDK